MADAFAGAAAGELLGRTLRIIENGLNYESTKASLESTLEDLNPVVQQIIQYNEKMHLPAHESIEKLMDNIAASQEFIRNRKINCWNFFHMPSYQRKLEKMDKSLVRCITVQMQIEIVKCLKDIQSKLSDHDSHRLTLSAAGNLSNHGIPADRSDLEIPEFTVGILDGPLMKQLKFELLREGGEQVLNLTGMAGSGKTTLAKHLCRDPLITGKFKDNIFFKPLGQQNQSNEHQAANQSGYQLSRMGNGPVLLVLDNVWPGSEKLVEKYSVQIPSDSKILVISRVAFPEIGTTYPMKMLCEEDAEALFLHHVQPSNIDVDDGEIRRILLPVLCFCFMVVEGCKGLPLALKFMGSNLRGKTIENWQKVLLKWSQGHSILDSSVELLTHLQNSLHSLHALEDESINECFIDLGLFPEDRRIPVTALIDMWIELYKLDEHGICAMTIINQLTATNLADIIVRRKVGSDADNYYSNHFLMQHNILRELAIRKSNQETFEKRKRLIVDINGNNRPEWWPQQQEQQLTGPKHQSVGARIVSISTDQTITPDWCNIEAAEAEVLVLNLKTKEYTLPEFMRKMKNLKVVVVTNYGFHPAAELKNLELLGSLWSLKRIRLQRVSVPCLCELKTVQKLSLYMCEVKKAFENCCTPFSKAMPNLVELNIEYCRDMVKLPAGLCDIVTLKKLNISSCHKFIELPKEIGKLENLDLLRVSDCANFEEMPESIPRLQKLTLLDISYCPSLRTLPENIDGLKNLRKLYMTDCSIHELPESVIKMEHLNVVICDDCTYPLWEIIKYIHPRLHIKTAKYVNLNWLPHSGSSAFFL